MGFGPKYINYEEGETYTTLAREGIKVKTKTELVSEEMRVLYVALTRAKEKLIITGTEKDYSESIGKKEELLASYKEADSQNKINKNIIGKYKSYLDWIELVYLKRKEELDKFCTLNIYKDKDILKEDLEDNEKETRNLEDELEKVKEEELDKIREKLEWEYKYKIPKNILTKSSVTRIKSAKLDLEEDKPNGVDYKRPEFLKEDKGLTGAERGTLMHLVLQKLDTSVTYDISSISDLINTLEQNGVISEKEKEAVDKEKLLKFTTSIIWKEMTNAKVIERERPFYISIPASEIYEEDIDENVLVQGVIDLYYINADDKLVLVDYKTDKNKSEAEFIEEYKEQLRLYKMALEKSLSRNVDKVYIYSVELRQGSRVVKSCKLCYNINRLSRCTANKNSTTLEMLLFYLVAC